MYMLINIFVGTRKCVYSYVSCYLLGSLFFDIYLSMNAFGTFDTRFWSVSEYRN